MHRGSGFGCCSDEYALSNPGPGQPELQPGAQIQRKAALEETLCCQSTSSECSKFDHQTFSKYIASITTRIEIDSQMAFVGVSFGIRASFAGDASGDCADECSWHQDTDLGNLNRKEVALKKQRCQVPPWLRKLEKC